MTRRAQVLPLLVTLVAVCGVAKGEIAYQRVRSAGALDSGGRYPQARLLLAPDGVFYGTTYQGGNSDRGTLFTLNPDGSGFRVLHAFTGFGGDGANPYADLILRSDGFIYGTTERGGNNDGGTIFKVRPDGSGYQVLFRFFSVGGFLPRGHLLEGTDGFFYSTTQTGGPGTWGTVYKIRPDGTGFAVLHAFGTMPGDGADCDGGLTLASDGRLYGVSSSGPLQTSFGALFRLNQDGSGFEVLHQFMGTDGYEPDGRPLELADGALYGTTELSIGNGGVIYKVNKDGTGFQILHVMPDTNGIPGSLTSELVPGSDGALYSTGVSALYKIRPDGTGVELLHTFVRSTNDGWFARGVIFGNDGALYGAAQIGGAYDSGVIYRIQPDGSGYSILHHFRHIPAPVATPRASLVETQGVFFGTSEAGGRTNAGTIFSLRANGTDGRVLFSFGLGTNAAKAPNRLCLGGDGFLYGTTSVGGNSNVGVIFRIGQDGSNYSVLRHLGAPGEPRGPRSGLIMDAGGWLYGSSLAGGNGNLGTVYKIHKDTAELVVLRSLTTSDGYQPQCDLLQVGGNLYGTATIGGAQNFGVVFRIETNGNNYTVLHSFTSDPEGQTPVSGVILASDGRLYGTTSRTFRSFAGAIYTLNLDGSGFHALRVFTNALAEPRLPRPGLVEAPDGFLYGATQLGAAAEKGTLFRIRKDGTGFAILHEFAASIVDGQTPSAAFTPVGDGSFLGVTEAGGDNGTGTIFRFDPTEVRLTVNLTATGVHLTWPVSSTRDALEATTALNVVDWYPTGATITQGDGEYEMTVPRQADGEFYRVQRTWE